jgi:hypothetical protein
MLKSFQLTNVICLLSVFMLGACAEKSVDTPVVEDAEVTAAPAEVEANAVVVEGAGTAAALVVEQSTDESEEAFRVTTAVQLLTAKVVSIDSETREVVLVKEDGQQFELMAREDAINLDQVSPGDTVNARFIEQISMQLVKGEGMRAVEMVTDQAAHAQEGEMPARAEVIKKVTVYTVEAIDIEANTFKLKDVNDQVREYTAENPANLAKAAVGDALVVTTVEAMAVDVVKTAAE